MPCLTSLIKKIFTVFKQKTKSRNFRKKSPHKKSGKKKVRNFFFILQNHEMKPKIEVRNSWDHEL